MSNPTAATAFHLPELGEGVYEAELVSWLVKPGDAVKRGQSLMEVLTDKATMEVPSPFAGAIVSVDATPGNPVKVGDVVLHYTVGTRVESPPPPVRTAAEPSRAAANGGTTAVATPPRRFTAVPEAVQASPSVRLMARKLGIDLTGVRGTGPGGRVLIEDLANALPSQAPEKKKPPEPKPDYGTPGTRVKLVGLRRKIADHMVASKRTIPHYAYVDECDVTDLVRLRESLRQPFADKGVKLTYLAFFVKAAAHALKEIPVVNASLDETAGEMVYHDRYHIGVAVATPSGLIVPVVRDADRKDVAQIARDIDRLGSEARTSKIKLEDLRGGTFTVSSVGSIGGLISTPVINHPEVAILGVGKVVKRPVFDAAGQVRAADMVYLSLSFDHRVVDGAVGAAFGNALIKRLQNPAAMLVAW